MHLTRTMVFCPSSPGERPQPAWTNSGTIEIHLSLFRSATMMSWNLLCEDEIGSVSVSELCGVNWGGALIYNYLYLE